MRPADLPRTKIQDAYLKSFVDREANRTKIVINDTYEITYDGVPIGSQAKKRVRTGHFSDEDVKPFALDENTAAIQSELSRLGDIMSAIHTEGKRNPDRGYVVSRDSRDKSAETAYAIYDVMQHGMRRS